MYDNINKNNIINWPLLIGGGVDCLITPHTTKNLVDKSFLDIKTTIAEEIERVNNYSLQGISISIPNLGHNEGDNICKILEMSDIHTNLIWLVNISHSPLPIVEKAISCIKCTSVINFVTLESPRVQNIFKIVKSVNGIIIVQLIDERGLPHTVHERIQLIKKLEKEMLMAGLNKHNILVDILTPPLGTINEGIKIALETIRLLKDNEFKTITWLNNISAGYSNREQINILYATMLLTAGIDSIVLDSREDTVVKAIKLAINLIKGT